MDSKRFAGTDWKPLGDGFIRIFLMAAVYFAAGKLGLKLASLHMSVSPVWPPTGIALAAVMVYGNRIWPGIWLGAFLINLTTTGDVLTSFGIAAGNTAEAVFGAWLVRRFANGCRAFDTARDIFLFIFCVALATSISASVGMGSLTLAGLASFRHYVPLWFTWWLGDAVSAVIFTPFLIIWWTHGRPRLEPKQILEAVLILISVVLAGNIVFASLLPPFSHFSQSFVCLPPLLWAAFRFGPRGAATAAFVLSCFAIWGTLQGFSPFALSETNESLLLLQVFLGTATVGNLVLGAAVAERQRAQEALHVKEFELQRITDVTPTLLAHCSRDLRFIFVNRAYASRAGLPPEQIIGKSVVEVLGQEQFETIRPHIERVLAGQSVRFEAEINFKTVGLRSLSAAYEPERNDSGAVIGWVASLHDITDRKRAEEELKALQHELELRVERRTGQLVQAQKELVAEVDERRRLEIEIAHAAEREQKRLGFELHEGLGQRLTGIVYLLTTLRAKWEKISLPRSQELAVLEKMLLESVAEVRGLAKGFYPVDLEHLGLQLGLEELARTTEATSNVRCVVQCNSVCDEIRGLLLVQLFRIAEEAAQNAVKHGQPSRIAISVIDEDEGILLKVEDDGVGAPGPIQSVAGMGWQIMRYRANMIGAKLEFRNLEPSGALVTCLMPRKQFILLTEQPSIPSTVQTTHDP